MKICCTSLFFLLALRIFSLDAGSPEDFKQGERRLEEMRQAKRQSLLPRPYFFIRSQTKYSGRLYQYNYTHDDRPLFLNRRLWEDGGSDHTRASFRKTFEIFRLYDLDGFAAFAPPSQLEYDQVLKVLYDAAKELNLPPAAFSILLEIAPDNPRNPYSKMVPDTMRLITDNPYSFRIGSKSVLSSYTIDRLSTEELRDQLDPLREKSGQKILFLPQMIFVNLTDSDGERLNGHDLYQIYRTKKTIPLSLIQRMEEYLRSYLDVCDGIYLGHFSSRTDDSLDEGFSNEILLPIINSVLSEPKYNGRKLFGIMVKTGYTSYYGAQSLSRDGTRTLRNFLESARRFHPDMIIGTEWDELNEDTGFQPLAAKPMSSQRIIRYYMSLFKGIPPSPNPGDDLSVPNLILSQRRQLLPGEIMKLELLNVPDSPSGTECRVTLELTDEDGGVVYGPHTVSFNTSELKEFTFTPPGEQFALQQVLRTRLRVEFRGKTRTFYTGLPFTIMRTTVTDDLQYYSTPLRNVLTPLSDKIEIGDAEVNCFLKSPEKLVSAEIMQNQLEFFAIDAADEYLRNDPSRRFFELTYQYLNNPSPPKVKARLGFQVKDAPSLIAFNPPENPLKTAGRQNSIPPYAGSLNRWERSSLFSVSTDDIPKAKVQVRGTRASGPHKGEKFVWEVPLKDLEKQQVVAKVFEDGVTLGLSVDGRPVSIPLPLDTDQIDFKRTMKFSQPGAVVALRVISEGGKVFWSAPHVLASGKSAGLRPVSVFSNSKNDVIKLALPDNRVPDVVYDFNPAAGNVLKTSAGRMFYAMIGSYQSVATGFIGLEGSYTPFQFLNRGIFKEASKPSPEWVRDGGRHALRFDGENGNFIMFPNLVIPQRAGYTVTFDIKPDDVEKYHVLLAHQSIQKSGLILGVKSGKFQIAYDHRNWNSPDGKWFGQDKFDTDIPLFPGKWQTVKFTYDGTRITLGANGKTQSFPMRGTGIFIQSAVFGGRGERSRDGTVPFYKGLLGSFEVKHWVD